MIWLIVGALGLLVALALSALRVARGQAAEVAAYFRDQVDELADEPEATTGFVASGGGGTAEGRRTTRTSAVPGRHVG
jgi:hypothetical protein